jgi:CBS domain-containing protein
VTALDGQTRAHLTDGSYAAGALDVDQDQTLAQVERGMSVRLIATLENLVTATRDELAPDVLEKKMRLHGFDYLPVRRTANGPIIGIISADAMRNEGRDRNVAQIYEPLGPDDLISAEASLLHFVWPADQQPRRLVLEGKDIRGIVTLSDIQKLPVRISLFSLFIHFELLLTEYLRYTLRNKIVLEFVSAVRRQRS